MFNSLLRKISIYITYFEGLITYLITYLEDTGIGYGFQSSFHALTAPACLGIFFDFKYTDKLAIGGIDKMSTVVFDSAGRGPSGSIARGAPPPNDAKTWRGIRSCALT